MAKAATPQRSCADPVAIEARPSGEGGRAVGLPWEREGVEPEPLAHAAQHLRDTSMADADVGLPVSMHRAPEHGSSPRPGRGSGAADRQATERIRGSAGSGASSSELVTNTALRMRLPCNCISRVANVVR